jgi:hypothetical protein
MLKMPVIVIDLLSVAYTNTVNSRTEPSGSVVCSHIIQSPLSVLCEHVNVP